MVGAPRDRGMGPQPGQGTPVADSGHVLPTLSQRAAGPAIVEEGLAVWAQASEAALQVVALVGTGSW